MSSNWRSSETAQLYLNRHQIPVIWDIDTRALVRHIRSVGALRGVVATDGTAAEQLDPRSEEIAEDGRAGIGQPRQLPESVLRGIKARSSWRLRRGPSSARPAGNAA